MLEKRNSQRSKMVLPVKVLIDEATHLAHTVDITDVGAQLGGLQAQLQAGMTILLRRGWSQMPNYGDSTCPTAHSDATDTSPQS